MNSIVGRALLILISTTLIVSMFAASGGTVSAQQDLDARSVGVSVAYTSHDPIRIENDSDLITQATSEEWDGSGTSNDPYVISGYDINATGHGVGIYVGNTTLYLTVNGCQVHDTDATEEVGTLPDWAWSIVLCNVTNAVVSNNTCLRSTIGILLYESDGNTVRGNIATDLTEGFLIFKSEENVIEANTASDVLIGICSSFSAKNTISGNTLHDITTCMIIEYTNNSSITGNIIYDGVIGINLQNDVVSNTVSMNSITDCDLYGIEMFNARMNNITGNICVRCDVCIQVRTGSDGNHIIGNEARYGTKGIYVVDNDDNDVQSNLLENNDNGIYLGSGADDATVMDNTIRNNYFGMYLKDADGLVISENDISNNGDGIYAEDGSDDCTIQSNMILDNYCGIYIWNSLGSEISNNTLVDNTFGIDLDDASSSTLVWNLVQGSASYGILLDEESSGNELIGNVFVDNNGAGEEYDEDHAQACAMNGSNDWSDFHGGNFWSDWTSPDADHDGIVDVDYVIAGGECVDPLPLTESILYTVPGSIIGMVTDDQDNVLAGVTVSLDSGISTITDAYGRYSFENVTSGTYSIVFAKANYSTVLDDITVVDDEDMGTVTMSPELTEDDITEDADDGTLIVYAALGIVVLVAIAAIVIMFFRMRPKA